MKKKWLIAIILNKSGNEITEKVEQFVTQTVNSAQNKNVNVYLLIGQIKDGAPDIAITFLKPSKSGLGAPSPISLAPPNGKPFNNIGSGLQFGSSLTVIKKDFEEKNPDVKYQTLLITFDHGSGFGMFSGTGDGADEITPANFMETVLKENVEINDPNVKLSDFICYDPIFPEKKEPVCNKGFSFHTRNNISDSMIRAELEINPAGDVLTNREFATAIKNSFGKADLVIMLNCYMQNLDANYEFSDCVDTLVAAQTAMPIEGIPLKKLLDYIAGNDVATVNQITAHLKGSLKEFWNTRVTNELLRNQLHICASTVAKTNKLAERIGAAFSNVIPVLNEDTGNAIMAKRMDCDDFSEPWLHGNKINEYWFWIDAILFLDRCKSLEILPPEIVSEINSILDTFRNDPPIKTIFIGADVSKQPYGGVAKANGLCVFFPYNTDCIGAAWEVFYNPSSPGITTYASDSGWGDFVNAFTGAEL